MDKDSVKVCGICGDKALGYNFNAITCESCKAFFRRNALRNKEFKCPFDGNCKIDLVTRRFCQRCRLKKCFDIGMKKEWILSDEEKQVKRSKILENRKRKFDGNECSKGADSTTTDTNSIQVFRSNHLISNDSQSMSPNVYQNFTGNEIIETERQTNLKNGFESNFDFIDKTSKTIGVQNTANYNSFCDSLINNSYFDDSEEYSATDLIQTNMSSNASSQFLNISNNSIISNENMNTRSDNICKTDELHDIPEIVYRKAIEMEFSSIPIRKPINDLNGNNFLEFSQLESNKLCELFNALVVLRDPCIETSQVKEVTGILDALKMTDQAVRRMIKMAKRLQTFKSLRQSDQIALLKGGCTELIILRSVITYNYEREYFTVVMDSNSATLVKLDVLKQAKGNVYEAHKRFMHTFRQEWDSDQTILDLLTAITLFSSERPNITHKEMVKLEGQSYMYLLQRYLEIKYRSKCEAKSKFLRFMTKLEELHILNEDHIRMYLDADPNDFGPLLLEIFDLKP